MRRIRPTFLLRCVVLAVSVGLFVAVFKLSSSLPATLATGVLLVAFWFLGIDGGLLPDLLEYILVRRAGRRQGVVRSIWFVDAEQERDEEREAHEKATSNNPTIPQTVHPAPIVELEDLRNGDFLGTTAWPRSQVATP